MTKNKEFLFFGLIRSKGSVTGVNVILDTKRLSWCCSHCIWYGVGIGSWVVQVEVYVELLPDGFPR